MSQTIAHTIQQINCTSQLLSYMVPMLYARYFRQAAMDTIGGGLFLSRSRRPLPLATMRKRPCPKKNNSIEPFET